MSARFMTYRFEDRRYGFCRTVDGPGVGLWLGRRAVWLVWEGSHRRSSPLLVDPREEAKK